MNYVLGAGRHPRSALAGQRRVGIPSPSNVLIAIWASVGGLVLSSWAAARGARRELYESSEIDGDECLARSRRHLADDLPGAVVQHDPRRHRRLPRVRRSPSWLPAAARHSQPTTTCCTCTRQPSGRCSTAMPRLWPGSSL